MSSLANGRPQISRKLRHVLGHVSVFSRALFYQITLECINNSRQPTQAVRALLQENVRLTGTGIDFVQK